MTPKQKAEELIDKMTFETHSYNAKHCALVSVDEILNIMLSTKEDKYWREVKKEIEKL